jgi:hypothetical protein
MATQIFIKFQITKIVRELIHPHQFRFNSRKEERVRNPKQYLDCQMPSFR